MPWTNVSWVVAHGWNVNQTIPALTCWPCVVGVLVGGNQCTLLGPEESGACAPRPGSFDRGWGVVVPGFLCWGRLSPYRSRVLGLLMLVGVQGLVSGRCLRTV